MEREWWLMALLGFVVLAGLMLLVVFTHGFVDPVFESDSVALTQGPTIDVSVDPGRAMAGVGTAIVLLFTALRIIKRTDWSIDEP